MRTTAKIMDLQCYFFIVKMVHSDTYDGYLDIIMKLDTMKLSQFKHGIPRVNLHIPEWMNEISIVVETYSEIVRQIFNL